MDETLKQKLQTLAEKYEVESFVQADPSQFLRWYNTQANTESAAFIAAMLAFGSRTQFIPKIRSLLQLADKTSGSINAWLLSGSPGFPTGLQKYYRFYSNDDMLTLFSELADILRQSGTLGEYFRKKWEISCEKAEKPVNLYEIISQAFPKARIVPKGKNSANKRIHMFLRWMVRTASPVDLGIWDWYSPANLIIPLDVHVMQESVKLGLLPPTARASLRTAEQLSAELAKAFPGDPTRADYALFGLGVDENLQTKSN